MFDISELDPKIAADKLRSEYKAGALFQASCQAYEAIEKNDISKCLFWREVLKILDAKYAEEVVVSFPSNSAKR